MVAASLAGLDLNDAATFVWVAKAGSFSAVARTLGVPVSTVSRRVARLEAALGTRLLERTTRAVRLSDTGRAYLDHAEQALDELGQGVDRVRELHSVPRGPVRITAPLGLAETLLGALAPFLEGNPLVTAELEITERRVDLLAEGFDVAVRTGPVEEGALVARRLFESPRGLFASAGYLERRGRPRRLTDLDRHDLVSVRGSSVYGTRWELGPLDGSARLRTVEVRPRIVTGQLLVAQRAAAAGLGIALLPEEQVPPGSLERVLPGMAGRSSTLWLVYLGRRARTAAVRACVDHLQMALGDSARAPAG